MNNSLPTKQDFIDRKVSEPLAIRLAGEYDVFDKRDPRAELFQHGLRSRDLNGWWEHLLGEESVKRITIDELEEHIALGGPPVEILPDGRVRMPGLPERLVANLLKRGEAIKFARDNEYREVITQQGFDVQFEGLTYLACNSHELDIRSQLFVDGIRDHHDALLGFTYTGHDWRVSMYHVPNNEHHDLSQIAVKYGGGGHRGACGFRIDKLPFLP